MDCIEVSERLLAQEPGDDPELERHVADCAACAHMASGLHRLDSVLSATLLVSPPLELQQRLAQVVAAASQPAPLPWWRRLLEFDVTRVLAQRPQMIAVQGLASVMLALASWQIFGWLTTFQPVIGDVGYAVELVAASPAAVYLGSIQIDFQSLGIWSVVGIAGWLVSENGALGRRLGRLRLP